MKVVNIERSRSGLACSKCSCRKRAGSTMGTAVIAWNSSILSGNSVRRITRWPPTRLRRRPHRALRTPPWWTPLNSAGVPVRYLQLVHNTSDPVAGAAKMKVLHSFGREEELDRAAIERLIASLSKLLHPTGALTGAAAADGSAGGGGLEVVSSRARGATWALDGVWAQLGLDALLRRLLEGTRRDARTERIIFGLVAARAIEPGSKLATAGWLTRRTRIGGLTDGDIDGSDGSGGVSEDECYRAMD